MVLKSDKQQDLPMERGLGWNPNREKDVAVKVWGDQPVRGSSWEKALIQGVIWRWRTDQRLRSTEHVPTVWGVPGMNLYSWSCLKDPLHLHAIPCVSVTGSS